MFLLLLALPTIGHAEELRADILQFFQGGGMYEIRAVTADSEGSVYVAGSTGAFDLPLRNPFQNRNPGSSVIVSGDGGHTWAPRGFIRDLPFTGVAAPAVHPRDPNILLTRGTRGLYRSTNGGESWDTVLDANTALDPRVWPFGNSVFDPSDPRIVYAAAGGAVLKSTDTGIHWNILNVGLEQGYCCLGSSIAIDPTRPSRLIYNTNRQTYLTENSGASWRLLPVAGNHAIFDPSRPGTVYLHQYDALLGSTDGGNTWTKLPLETRFLGWLTLDPGMPGRLYAGVGDLVNGGSPSLARSSDYGQTWTYLTAPARFTAVAVPPGQPNSLLAVGDSGAFTSSDAGSTWRQLPISRSLWDLSFDPSRPGRVYAAGPPTPDGFLAKFNAAGELVYSTYLGGQGTDTIEAIAVDPSGDVVIAGTSRSSDFPSVTHNLGSGAFVSRFHRNGQPVRTTTLDAGPIVALARGGDGSWHLGTTTTILKLSTAADRILYEQTFPGQLTTLAMDADGQSVVAAGSNAVIKYTGAGAIAYSRPLPITPRKLVLTSTGELWIAGEATTTNPAPVSDSAYQAGIRISCGHNSGAIFTRPDLQRPGWMTDAYIGRLDADGTLHDGTYFGGACRETVSDLAVAPDGSLWISGETYSDPVATAPSLFAPPLPGSPRPFVAKLSAGGHALLAAGYLDYGSAARLATAANTAFLTLNSPNASSLSVNEAERNGKVLRLSSTEDPDPDFAVLSVSDAFTQNASVLAPLQIVTVKVSGLEVAQEIDLGLAPPDGAPLQLSGVSLEFDGVPAPLLAVRSSEITCLVPKEIRGRVQTAVRVIAGQRRSRPRYIGVVDQSLVLYPVVRNADGSENGPDNPAPAGSLLTFYFTGAGLPDTDGLISVRVAFYFHTTTTIIREVQPVPGFVSGLVEAKVVAPAPGVFGIAISPTTPGYPAVYKSIPVYVSP
ncbi:MAG: SBBP repeat-containing protein [Bryobacterales bacterium]|nr:SBBP repeat-containing protein [Bryobacterales bacterium]